MPPLYLTAQGSKLRYRNRRLVVDQEGQEIAAVPAVHVDQVLVFGNISVTTPALTFLLDKGIDTAFLTVQGRFKGRLVGPTGGNGRLRLLQYGRVSDSAWALETARAIVRAKLHNTRTLLRRYARRRRADETPEPTDSEPPDETPAEKGQPTPVADSLAVPSALSAAADQLGGLLEQIGRCRAMNCLNGLEGRAAAIYFGVLRHLITAPGWTFERRTRRPPRDPVNALLSFGYTVLSHNIEAAVRATGLDPYLGFLHQVAYNRPSLALDLVEEFRTIVVDSVVLRCLNNLLIRPSDFTYAPEAEYPVLLNEQGKATFIRELEGRLHLTFRHPATGEQVTYRRCFQLQAREIARCVQSGAMYQPYLVR